MEVSVTCHGGANRQIIQSAWMTIVVFKHIQTHGEGSPTGRLIPGSSWLQHPAAHRTSLISHKVCETQINCDMENTMTLMFLENIPAWI